MIQKKKQFFWMTGILGAAVVFSMGFTACNNGESDGGGGTDYGVFNGFYNYPAGRTNANGKLTIRSNAAGAALVFNGTVKKENYLGTINGAGSSINVTLPEDKFYTIVAVEREAYEEFGDKAFQSSILTYYSNNQGYTVTLTPNGLGGNALWRMHNHTKYWVELRSQDGSETYAVIAPQTYYVDKPVMLDQQYRYIPHFYRELKYSVDTPHA